MRARIVGVALLCTLAFGAASEGQIFRYMAFGDSITAGRDEFDPTGQGGYPGRLDNLLNCFPPNCEVVNKGLDGEKTAEGVTRIQTLLNADPWDIVLLMEGTNDVFNNISNNTIEANLTIMDDKARLKGVDTLHGSMIRLDPDSTGGMDGGKVAAVTDMRNRVQNLAAARNRYFADPWLVLCPSQACFDAHYHNPPGAVGHPDPSGFDILADAFRNSIVARPVPALPVAVAPTGTITTSVPTYIWNKESGGDANWYQLRLLDSGGGQLHLQWFQETTVCSGSQCSRVLGSLPDGDYTWEVRGRNPRGRSAWRSTPFTIETLLPPTAASPTAPVGLIGEVSPIFQWDREQPVLATAYRLEVSDTGGVIHDTTYPALGNCAATACSADPFAASPLVAGAYTWRVQGSNSAGTGPWSAILSFEVIPGLIFSDGFESGDTSAWDSVLP